MISLSNSVVDIQIVLGSKGYQTNSDVKFKWSNISYISRLMLTNGIQVGTIASYVLPMRVLAYWPAGQPSAILDEVQFLPKQLGLTSGHSMDIGKNQYSANARQKVYRFMKFSTEPGTSVLLNPPLAQSRESREVKTNMLTMIWKN